MASIRAFLDDFGELNVVVSRRYYNGMVDHMYIMDDQGHCYDCVVRCVEESEKQVEYQVSMPCVYEFGRKYRLYVKTGYSCVVECRFIVRSDMFEELFAYSGKDLGSRYHKTSTDFALWAPTATGVTLKLVVNGEVSFHTMKRSEKGVYRVKVRKDLKHALYSYFVERDGMVVECLDPYAFSSNANGDMSAVIDLNEIKKIPDDVEFDLMKSDTDAIIYECSIRDMTASKTANTKTRGKFVSLLEEGTTYKGMPTGLDYLTSLGVTHVQFMPVVDFATVNEMHVNSHYNWGYDPFQFAVLEGWYASNPNDPYARMLEFKTLVATLHKKGLRVNLDMVFNHMYDHELTSLHKIVPYYYFRYTRSGKMSNGSYCGNDLDSTKQMMRHMFAFIIETFMHVYGVDGFRFDLMGILDVDTMRMLTKTARKHKKDAMMYGEGWNMPTSIDDSKKAMILNQEKLPVVGYFNDTFRDILKGGTGDDQMYESGYLTGNEHACFDACSAFVGNTLKEPYFYRFDTPGKSINGIETHDNATLWDKMHYCCHNEPRWMRVKRQKMCIAATLVSQGVPFLHSGIEFCGTKSDCKNSYNAGDAINAMNYDRLLMNQEVYEYTKKVIALRKEYKEFRLPTSKKIVECVSFGIDADAVMFYKMNLDGHETCVIVNPTVEDRTYKFELGVEVLLDENGNACKDTIYDVHVSALSILVIRK